MRNHTVTGLALAAGVLLVAVALSAPANAGSLRQGSTAGGSAVTGALPGQVLWTYYQTIRQYVQLCPPDGLPDEFEDFLCNTGSIGDNIIRLINPNGAANASLGSSTQPVCAMIYVFDDDEEMGECCGCPLSSAQLATFSVEKNLTSNWGIQGPEPAIAPANGNGAIAIVAAALNPALVSFVPGLTNGHGCAGTQSGACNVGCDPANTPGYTVTTANNLLGSVTHNQAVQVGQLGAANFIFGINEVGLSDDAGGDPTNLTYLQTQCGALVGNGSGSGICDCPLE